MRRSIEALQTGFLTPEQVRVSHDVMGLDTQLIRDGTYFVVESGERIAGCGGWSWRSTLYGGDESMVSREPEALDPATDAARIRAMYTDPDFARQGVGRLVMQLCEGAAMERRLPQGNDDGDHGRRAALRGVRLCPGRAGAERPGRRHPGAAGKDGKSARLTWETFDVR